MKIYNVTVDCYCCSKGLYETSDMGKRTGAYALCVGTLDSIPGTSCFSKHKNKSRHWYHCVWPTT